jgi:PAS domain S-box-containing protein
MILKLSAQMVHMLRNVSRIAILASILAVGLLTSYMVGTSVREEARNRWMEHAQYDVKQLTDTFISSLDEASTPIYALATLFRGRNRVTSEEFKQAVEFMKANRTGYFPAAMLFSRPRGDQDWIIEMATENPLGLDPGVSLSRIPEAKENIVSALEYGDLMILGNTSELLPTRYYAFTSIPVKRPEGNAVLTGVLDLTEIDTNVAEKIPYGLGFAISSRHASGLTVEGRDHLYPEGKDSSDAVKHINIEGRIGEASLYFHWGVLDSYRGGPASRLATLILVGGILITLFITVFIAFILAQKTQIERRVAEQTKYLQLMERIAVASNEASYIEDAVQVCLDEVCALTGWSIGHVFQRSDEDRNEFISAKIWHLDEPRKFKEFKQISEDIRFTEGSGLPGRVAQSGKPSWITNVTKDPDFPRAHLVKDIGVKAAFAFPIMIGNEVSAVLEFFTPEEIEPDQPLLDVMLYVGTQLGRIVERWRAAEALRQSEKQHRFIQVAVDNSAESCLWVRIDDGVLAYINDSYCKALGYSQDELMSLKIPDFDPDIPAWSDFAKELKSQNTLTFESRNRRKDGQIFPVEVVARYVEFEDDPYCIAFVRDISERKQAEDALIKSKEEVESANAIAQTTLENMGQGILMVDAQENVLVCNDQLLEFVDITRDEADRCRTFEELVRAGTKRVGEELTQQALQIAREGGQKTYEVTYKDSRTVEIRQNPLAGGGFVRTYTDITSMKAEQERFRSLLSSAPDAIVIVNKDGKIQLVNEQTAKLFEWSQDELIGKPIEILIPERFRAGHPDLLSSYFKDPSIRPMGAGLELSGVTRSGHELPVEITLSPIETDEGTVVAASVRDITVRKEAETMLQFRLELEQLVGAIATRFATDVELNDAINSSLQELGELVKSDRASIWQKSSDNTSLSMTHEWCADGVESKIHTRQNWSRQEFEETGLQHFFDAGEPIHISDIKQLSPEQPVYRQFFESKNISSFASIPIMEQSRLVSFFTLDEPLRLNEQKNFDIGQLKLFAESFYSALQRRKAETALVAAKEDAERSSSIIDTTLQNMEQGIIMVDDQQKILIHNDQLADYVNAPREQVNRCTTFEDIVRLNYEPGDEGYKRSMGLANLCSHEVFELTRADEHVIEVTQSPLNSGGFVRTYTDITARKQVEEVLRESEQQLISILEESVIGVAIVRNEDSRIIFLNSRLAEMMRMSRDDLLNQNVADRYVDSEQKQVIYERLKKDGVVHDAEALMKRGDDSNFTVLMSLSPMTYQDQSTRLAWLYDITEQKQMQQELADAKFAAEAATEAKATFLASMSHEIRTPMNGVIGMVDLLRQTELKGEQKQMLQTIGDSGQSLLTIINDILDFSKIEAGKLDLESIPLSLLDVVEGSAQTIAANATKKELRLITYIDPKLPQFVSGDPVRIRQIIINLGGNAIKFTEEGQVVIRAERVENNDDDNVTIRFSVIDQGIGISEEGQGKLFKAFSQAEASTTRQFGGTGLGLTICKSLTEMMGGEIGVNSTLGEGAEFYSIIPFAPSDKQVEGHTAKDLSGLRMLLVNNNPIEQTALQHYLEHWKSTVDIRDELEGVLERCQAALDEGTPYDVVVIGPQWTREDIIPIGDAAKEAGHTTRFVFLLQGTRHRARIDSETGVFLDVNPLRRAAFISAVAIAAGRESPEVHYEEEVEDMKSTGKALTVEEAREQGTLILVAEDNATNRDVIGRQLTLLGYTCEMAEDGQLALDAWRKQDYAILLTDCNMPNMDGFELTKTIRQDEEGTDTHATIVAITANALQGEAERCLETGMDDYMSKPIDMKELREKLHKWMPEGKETSDQSLQDEKTNPDEMSQDEGNGPIDESTLKSMFGDDPEIFKEILVDFIKPSKNIIQEMQSGYDRHLAEAVKQAAHKLKSAAASVGANELAELCSELETAGKKDDWDVINQGTPRLDQLMDDVESYINGL